MKAEQDKNAPAGVVSIPCGSCPAFYLLLFKHAFEKPEQCKKLNQRGGRVEEQEEDWHEWRTAGRIILN